ncbi:hypothetical protein BDF20DRAFT_849149 [Mycotypha africana]|uniref:uncharacterized protein n=1 Tax=Mycotypha africana TaxID=64632 RepID=UPI002300123B|nr:uncharacterized protein BDF20DRAFT_849149 [Mycotypha africana]KAI8987269.1 hypothetical protein BDF20DRAFT_849149 [Mycotypha africana]
MVVIEELVEEQKSDKVSEEATKEVKDATPHEQEEDKGFCDQDGDVFFDSADYHPDELERLKAEATEYKAKGNTFFGQGDYTNAISEYENALMICPESLKKERAVFFGNIAACHMKQNNFKEAKEMCTQALTLDPKYIKALLRRAQANEKLATSTALSESLEDYKKLKGLTIDSYTQKECRRAERELPPKIEAKREQEKEEMMGKLKDLGNSLLGKFGLSTDNFQLQKDPNSGGYSVNFVKK